MFELPYVIVEKLGDTVIEHSKTSSIRTAAQTVVDILSQDPPGDVTVYVDGDPHDPAKWADYLRFHISALSGGKSAGRRKALIALHQETLPLIKSAA